MKSIFSTICRVVTILISLAIVCLITFNVVLYFLQDKLIFDIYKLKPHMHYSRPANSEDVMFRTNDGLDYLCWLVKTEEDFQNKPAVLYILGNGSYKENNKDDYEDFVKALDVNVLACSTRGSGAYEGKPKEDLLYSDSQMYLNYLTGKFKHVFVHGSSMGGAVAIELAYKNPDKLVGLSVVNTFLSLRMMAKAMHPVMYFFTIYYDWIIRTKMENDKKIRFITMPSLFSVSLKDQKVPPEHTQELYRLSPSPNKFLFKSKNGTHNNIRKDDDGGFFEMYKKFIKESLRVAEEKSKRVNVDSDNISTASSDSDDLKDSEKRIFYLRN